MANEKTAPRTELNIVDITSPDQEVQGNIQTTDSVISAIVRKYALSVDGVIRFPNQGLVDSLADILSKRNSERNIIIKIKADEGEEPLDGAVITLSLIFRFGVCIPEVAQEIQRVVKEKVETMTHYKVAKVNINVLALEEVNEEAAPETETVDIVEDEEAGASK